MSLKEARVHLRAAIRSSFAADMLLRKLADDEELPRIDRERLRLDGARSSLAAALGCVEAQLIESDSSPDEI